MAILDQDSSEDQYCWGLSILVCTSIAYQASDAGIDLYDNLFQRTHPCALGTYQNRVGVGWARHVVGAPARVLVPKENPSQCNLLSSLSTKNTACDSIAVHVQHCQPHAHEQTNLVLNPNKIHQT